MWKKLLISMLTVGAAFTLAADDDVDMKIGDFKPGKDKLPAGWVLNTGVKHTGKAELAPDPKDKDDYVVNFEVESGTLHIYVLKSYPAAPGETYKLEAEVEGRGKAGIGLYFYGKNRYIGDDFRGTEVAIDGKTEIKRTITVPASFKDGKVADGLRFAFFVPAGSKLTLKEFEAEKIIKK